MVCVNHVYLGGSIAKLMYGALLHLPGKLFSASDDTLPDATSYDKELSVAMQGLWVTPTRTPLLRQVFIPQEFSTCTHIRGPSKK